MFSAKLEVSELEKAAERVLSLWEAGIFKVDSLMLIREASDAMNDLRVKLAKYR